MGDGGFLAWRASTHRLAGICGGTSTNELALANRPPRQTKYVKHANACQSNVLFCCPKPSRLRFVLLQPYQMDPPNLGALELSDSDTDALFDTPAVRKANKKIKDEADAGDTAASGKARAKESHYTTEEAREGALRRELESIRNVNKVIEGVIESLQKAKDNMAVRGARASRHGARANGSLRPYHVPFKMHRPCSTHGPGYCPRPSTISGSF